MILRNKELLFVLLGMIILLSFDYLSPYLIKIVSELLRIKII